MGILPNARHERFAQNVVKGMSATEAYEKAGYKPNDGSEHHSPGRKLLQPRLQGGPSGDTKVRE